MQPCRYATSFVSFEAHTFTQLHFSLTDATHWMNEYNGFNYEEFYEFIVDFLKVDQTLEGKAATTELYNWWNRYVCMLYTTPEPSLMIPQPSIPRSCCNVRCFISIGPTSVARDGARAAPSSPISYPCIVLLNICLINQNVNFCLTISYNVQTKRTRCVDGGIPASNI